MKTIPEELIAPAAWAAHILKTAHPAFATNAQNTPAKGSCSLMNATAKTTAQACFQTLSSSKSKAFAPLPNRS